MDFQFGLRKLDQLLKSEDRPELALRTQHQIVIRTESIKVHVRQRLQEMNIGVISDINLDRLLHGVDEYRKIIYSSPDPTALQQADVELRHIMSEDDIANIRTYIGQLVISTIEDMFQKPGWLVTPLEIEAALAPASHAPASSPATPDTQPAS